MGISLEVIQTRSMEEEEEQETAKIPIPLPKESYLWPPYFTLTTPRNLCEIKFIDVGTHKLLF